MFSCNFNRDQHVRAKHTGERPYACPCGKGYARRWLLLRHQRKHHPDHPEYQDASEDDKLAVMVHSSDTEDDYDMLDEPANEFDTPEETNLALYRAFAQRSSDDNVRDDGMVPSFEQPDAMATGVVVGLPSAQDIAQHQYHYSDEAVEEEEDAEPLPLPLPWVMDVINHLEDSTVAEEAALKHAAEHLAGHREDPHDQFRAHHCQECINVVGDLNNLIEHRQKDDHASNGKLCDCNVCVAIYERVSHLPAYVPM